MTDQRWVYRRSSGSMGTPKSTCGRLCTFYLEHQHSVSRLPRFEAHGIRRSNTRAAREKTNAGKTTTSDSRHTPFLHYEFGTNSTYQTRHSASRLVNFSDKQKEGYNSTPAFPPPTSLKKILSLNMFPLALPLELLISHPPPDRYEPSVPPVCLLFLRQP